MRFSYPNYTRLSLLAQTGFVELTASQSHFDGYFCVVVQYCSRGGELEYWLRQQVSYPDIYHDSFEAFTAAFEQGMAKLENTFSDGGLTREDAIENEARRAEERELAQWCVV